MIFAASPLRRFAVSLATLLAAGPAVAQMYGQWSPPSSHAGTVPSGRPWDTNFTAINLAVIPNRSPTGANPNDVVIAWDNEWQNPATMSWTTPWEQRYTVGNPEIPSTFENRWVTIPLGPNGLFLGDLFCAGHCWLPDGRLFIAGGNTQYSASFNNGDQTFPPGPTTTYNYRGSRYVGIWDPIAAHVAPTFGWDHLAAGPQGKPMRLDRWYPTVILISNRHVMVAGGSSDTNLAWANDPAIDTYELFDLQTMDWVRDPNSTPSFLPKLFDGPRSAQLAGGGSAGTRLGHYPRLHLLSNNQVITAGFFQHSTKVDPDPALPASVFPAAPGTSAWTTPLPSGPFRDYGTAVLVPNVGNAANLRDEVMVLGGGDSTTTAAWSDSRRLLAATAGQSWSPPQAMGSSRMVPNVVLTPNGEIVLIGGSSDNCFRASPGTPAYQTLVWNRTTGWQADTAQIGKRMYHSTAALLPSGKLVSAGGNDTERTVIGTNPTRYADWEIYTPRNLANGQPIPVYAGSWANPGYVTLTWNTTYVVDYAFPPPSNPSGDELTEEAVVRMVLMRPGNSTHHFDCDQRYVELASQPTSGNVQITVTTPVGPLYVGSTQGLVTALPGFYMAFLVTASGAVSKAKWVLLQ